MPIVDPDRLVGTDTTGFHCSARSHPGIGQRGDLSGDNLATSAHSVQCAQRRWGLFHREINCLVLRTGVDQAESVGVARSGLLLFISWRHNGAGGRNYIPTGGFPLGV